MTKKISKLVTVIAVVLVMAVSSMTTVVNAATINNAATPNGIKNWWVVDIDNNIPFWNGRVDGLVNIEDYGITFHCDTYSNFSSSAFRVYCQISNPALRADYASGAILDHVNDEGTDSFRRGWMDINGSNSVDYFVQAEYFAYGYGQCITGYAY